MSLKEKASFKQKNGFEILGFGQNYETEKLPESQRNILLDTKGGGQKKALFLESEIDI